MFYLLPFAFVLGYIAIALEHQIKVDKAATALLTAVVCWVLLIFNAESLMAGAAHVADAATHGAQALSTHTIVTGELRHHLGEIAEILFFLMGAMTIVELIDVHDGFKVVTDKITTTSKVKLLWVVSILAFFLSAIIDNLTTTIVMVSLLAKLIEDRTTRWTFVGMLIIAANAGGAWSPIGDVTTTMLWINHQITAQAVVTKLFLPSLACMLLPLIVMSFILKGNVERPQAIVEHNHELSPERERNFVLGLGVSLLLFVPIFKTVTHLPPYIGMLFGLSILWVITEILHKGKSKADRHELSVVTVLRKIDMSSILFFLGILLAIAALATAGYLNLVAEYLRDSLGNIYAINVAIGFLSAIVDNVPLVAGSMKMYPLMTSEGIFAAPEQAEWLKDFVVNGDFWMFLAYCAGTGGSCLIIGSAAGVTAMGMEKISFVWYLKHVTWLATIGYLAGAGVYLLMN